MTTTTQTTRVDGQRVRIVTRNGRVTIKPAPVEEWLLQAAAVRALRSLPEYRREFLLAGDMNAGRRSVREAARAKATGMEPGEPDLRVYGKGGRLLLIELKGAEGRLTPAQRERHPVLAALGHPVTVVKTASEDEAARLVVDAVRGWLGGGVVANDNEKNVGERAESA